MKTKLTLIIVGMFVLLTAFSIKTYAQATATPFTGPSDNTTAAPTSASSVAQVLCAGGAISLKGPTDPTGKFQWYKTDTHNVSTLVKEGVNGDNVYTETAAGAGYYTYTLVQLNANGCTSASSDPFKLYVLPPITAAVATSSSDVCAQSQTSANLTITGLSTAFTYTYQWTRNGTNIASATTNTYTVTEATASATPISYGVTIAYSLNSACTQAATPVSINVNPVPTKPVIVVN